MPKGLVALCHEWKWDEAKALIDKSPEQIFLSISPRRNMAAHAVMFHRNLEMLQYMYDALMRLPGPHDQMLRDAFERRGEEGYTPAHGSRYDGYLDCLKFLVAKCPSGPAILEVKNDDGCTPICEPIRRGRMEIVKFIMENAPSGPAILETKNRNGWTLAHFAARSSALDSLRYLMRNAPSGRAILEAKDNRGRTPAHYASNTWRVGVLCFLARNAPSGIGVLYVKDDDGKTPLDELDERQRKLLSNRRIREIGLERELNSVWEGNGPFVALIFSIVRQNVELLLRN